VSIVPASFYPTHPAKDSQRIRDRWIIDQRAPRAVLDPYRPYAFLVEDECSHTGEVVPVATVFLTNRECPWRCVMCDLWRNTLTESVPLGAIPKQIDYALERLPAARQIKLYNSGSFFDSRAIPTEDYTAIADKISGFERTIVECHPALVTETCLRFRDLLPHPLEIAMGLETVHPETLERLNKRMTPQQFRSAAEYLRKNGIDLRVFILVQPPFMKPDESLYWAQRSLDFAFDCGAAAATLIPTRGGNGAMETLALQGEFVPPSFEVLEAAMSYGLSIGRGRVFADLWDIRNAVDACEACTSARIARLHEMNLSQRMIEPVACLSCGGHS
jgi:radical SAM enzyme (TIGR01210 family)